MIRRDTDYFFVRHTRPKGFFSLGKPDVYWYLTNKSGKVLSAYKEADYRIVYEQQQWRPVMVAVESPGFKKWWLFEGELYWEKEGLDEEQVKALIVEMKAKKKRKVDRALAFIEQGHAVAGNKREPIAEHVRMEVWQRDGGCCVKCGSQENLEFDHVIPLSKGGSNTARNLQLLCEQCNRSKGASLT